jgi:hypothetical protein
VTKFKNKGSDPLQNVSAVENIVAEVRDVCGVEMPACITSIERHGEGGITAGF